MKKILERLIRKFTSKSNKKKHFKNPDENEKLKFEIEKQINDIRKYSLEYFGKLENMNDFIEFDLKIAHWTAFRNEIDRKNFLNKILALNFEKMSLIIERKNNFPYRLEIMNKSKVDEESVANFSKLISKIVIENNGLYESWEIVE